MQDARNDVHRYGDFTTIDRVLLDYAIADARAGLTRAASRLVMRERTAPLWAEYIGVDPHEKR